MALVEVEIKEFKCECLWKIVLLYFKAVLKSFSDVVNLY